MKWGGGTRDKSKNANSDGWDNQAPCRGGDQLYNVIVRAHAFIIIFFMVIAILIRGVGELTTTTNIEAPEIPPLG